MSAKRQPKALTVGEKLQMIKLVNEGVKKKDIAAKFNIPGSTLSTIIKNQVEIEKRANEGNIKCKRKRLAEFPDVEECMTKWFKQCRDKNIPVGGPIIREKAENFAKSLGHENFKASNGWLENFKRRHNITFKKVCGESAAVNNDVCEEWKSSLKNILAGYDPKNIFNADETALYFKCLPDKTYQFKDEKCHGGKHSKERVTILLATNMTGSTKLKPLVIGKAKNPTCFKRVKSLPVEYTSNQKAWMNTEVFSSWLTKLDKTMGGKKRKILLFVDNCTAHNTIPPLKWIDVKFLPANTTSKLQPLDAGIIKNFKVLYRTEVVRKFISDIEDGKACTINLLEAVRFANKCWNNITDKTIANCFKSCGFQEGENPTETEVGPQMEPDPEPEVEAEMEPPNVNIEAEWNEVTRQLPSENPLRFEEFALVDEGVAVTGTMTDDDILDSLTNDEDAPSDEDHEEEEPADVTSKEAKAAVRTLRMFLEKTSDVPDSVFSSIVSIENMIDKRVANSFKQKKITDFFNY